MLRTFLFLLLIKAFALTLLLAFSPIGLSPDEAQYWTWSQALDWGYYSKPPAIAWQIKATTTLFGNTEFGVRFGALLIGALVPLGVYFLAKRAGLEERGAFWSGVAMALSPLGVYLSLAATTDGGAIFFILLALLALFKERFLLAGLMILCGALFKWTAFVFWPIAFLFFPRWRLLGGFLFSLLAFLPPIYWNFTHDWVTFKHVGGAIGKTHQGNFFEFLGSQIALLSPIYFVLLIMGIVLLVKRGNRALALCGAFPLVASFYLISALFKKIQPNWAAYLYPPGMVLIGWTAYPRYRKWLHVGMWLSVVLVLLAFCFPWYAFRQAVGWKELKPALIQSGYNPNSDFLFGDKYQIASILSFYGPEQKRAYFFNLGESRKNQFSFWPQMQENEVGKTGYFVVIEKMNEESIAWYETHYLKRLQPYFVHVSYEGHAPLYEKKRALFFKCVGYLGGAPQDPEEY